MRTDFGPKIAYRHRLQMPNKHNMTYCSGIAAGSALGTPMSSLRPLPKSSPDKFVGKNNYLHILHATTLHKTTKLSSATYKLLLDIQHNKCQEIYANMSWHKIN